MKKPSWRYTAPTSLLAPSASLLLVAIVGIYSLHPFDAYAEVQIDLSAIGTPTEADRRIAPGRAPVQLRAPDRSTVQQIRLTPPPSLRGQIAPTGVGTGTTSERTAAQPAARPAPVVLEPASGTAAPTQTVSAPAASAIPTPPARTASTPSAATPQQARRPEANPAAASGTRVEPAPRAVATHEAAPTPASSPAQISTPDPLPVPALSAATPPPAPEPKPVQIASLPAPRDAAHRLRFETGDATLLPATRDDLELIAAELMRHADRIEVQAFAGETGDVSSTNRRLSLRRGLAVRKFLVEQGVLQSRIDVRALGGTKDSGPTERVDILLSNRQR